MNNTARIAMMHNIQEANFQSQLKAGISKDKLKAIVFKDKNGKRLPNSQLRGLARDMGVTKKFKVSHEATRSCK